MPSSFIDNFRFPSIMSLLGLLQSEWVYLPHGFSTQKQSTKGWCDESVARTQKKRWLQIIKSLEGTEPLTTAFTYFDPEHTRNDLNAHNIIMSYAYVLALASKRRTSLSILDWGGGIGLYRLLSQILFPNLKIKYHCFDTSTLCKLGRELLPDSIFYEEASEALQMRYDLVLASSSLQYFENWQEVFAKLARASLEYLYVARLPVVKLAKSFVALQKCSKNKLYGYDTEFISWFLNRSEFLSEAEQIGAHLVREFLVGETFFIKKAPEPNSESRAFLFKIN